MPRATGGPNGDCTCDGRSAPGSARGGASGARRDLVSTLRMVGYDGVLSIEHEDPLASPTEGLEKAVDVLQRAAFEETPGDAYWA